MMYQYDFLSTFPRSSVINFHRLRIFLAVARHLSFSQAAEEFHTSQPNVSRHIAKLEAELGASLFHRLGGRVALTDAGRTVYDHAQRVFEQIQTMQRALKELQGLERGYLRLAASGTPGLYLLPPLVATYNKEHPNLNIDLCLTNTQEVVDLVLGNQVDLGFIEAPVMTPKLQVQPYYSDEIVPIASPEHRLVTLSNVKPEDLGNETLILQEQGSGTRQVVEGALAHWGLKPQRVLYIQSCEGIKRTVAAGLGISFVSRLAIGLELEQKVLRILAGKTLYIKREISVVIHKDIHPSAAMLAFMAQMRKKSNRYQ